MEVTDAIVVLVANTESREYTGFYSLKLIYLGFLVLS
jgi:hypothetical protein